MATRPLSSTVMAVSPWNTLCYPLLGRFFTTENHQTPRFPTGAHLSTTNRAVNNPSSEKSPVASMVCEDVHRQVQGFSTSRCLVSNFEIRPVRAGVKPVCSNQGWRDVRIRAVDRVLRSAAGLAPHLAPRLHSIAQLASSALPI